MLVLSRKRSQRIVIGSSIRITVVKLDGNQVRLGIEAPDTCPIVRGELLGRSRPHPQPQPRRPNNAGTGPDTGRQGPGGPAAV
jgi:carbon storage regulator